MKEKDTRLRRKYNKLEKACNALYDAGYWQCDRWVDEKKLWEALRDALGRKKGTSPKRYRTVGRVRIIR